MLISGNSGSKRFESQHYREVHNYERNFIAHIFILHQVLLERCKAI